MFNIVYDVCLCMYLFIIHIMYYPGKGFEAASSYAHAKIYLKINMRKVDRGPLKIEKSI